MNTESGAVRYEDCPTRTKRGSCRCGRCAICSNPKHTAIHGPLLNQPSGS